MFVNWLFLIFLVFTFFQPFCRGFLEIFPSFDHFFVFFFVARAAEARAERRVERGRGSGGAGAGAVAAGTGQVRRRRPLRRHRRHQRRLHLRRRPRRLRPAPVLRPAARRGLRRRQVRIPKLKPHVTPFGTEERPIVPNLT